LGTKEEKLLERTKMAGKMAVGHYLLKFFHMPQWCAINLWLMFS
jgi:hypothetical protein